jgi:hypothetical protein
MQIVSGDRTSPSARLQMAGPAQAAAIVSPDHATHKELAVRAGLSHVEPLRS